MFLGIGGHVSCCPLLENPAHARRPTRVEWEFGIEKSGADQNFGGKRNQGSVGMGDTIVRAIAILVGVLTATICWPAVAEPGLQEPLPSMVSAPIPAKILLAGVRSSRESQAAEMAFWESIKDSTDPAEYQAYLQAFPKGIFAPLARARIRLNQQAAPAPEPQPAPAKKAEPAPAPAPAPVKKAEPARPAPPVVDPVEGNFIARTKSNVRRKPRSDSSILGSLKRGTPLEVLGKVRGQDWFQVQIDGGQIGFVAAGLVLKVARPSPAPTAPQPAKKTEPAPANAAAIPIYRNSVTFENPEPAPAKATAAPAASSETFRDCPTCPEMITLPAGSFQMGSNNGDPTERPVHRVTIGAPFAIGRFEVTVEQWRECFSDGACTFEPRATADPERTAVRNVSWEDAVDYTAWLSGKTGRKYRLPSEAEWEYAARSGSSDRYWWGNKPAANKASCKNCGGPWSRKAPTPAGSHDPNPFGLHDMNGGVAEWTADCWNRSYTGAPRDGSARTGSGCDQRVLRGGSWRNEAAYLGSAARLFYDADVRYLVNGFRVAASAN